MNERLNKTSICTVIFLDIVGYSKCTDAEQIAQKKQFNRLISEAIKSVAQNDRILLDTGDGAAIALLGAPEEALFIAMTIRDGIDALNQKADDQLLVRIGVNLGPVRVVKDINGRPNIIGDGINVAQRVMSFAEPNQILVSRSYYEITSRLSKEITELFTYSGVKQDKHVREHEVYAIGAYQQLSKVAAQFGNDADATESNGAAILSASKRWWPVGAVVFVLIALTVAIANGVFISDSTTEIAAEQEATAVSGSAETAELQQVDAAQTEILKQPEAQEQATSTQKTTKQSVSKPKSQAQEKSKQNKPAQQTSAASTTEPKEVQSSEKSTWDSFKESVKQGSDKKVFCSDAERSLKQCD